MSEVKVKEEEEVNFLKLSPEAQGKVMKNFHSFFPDGSYRKMALQTEEGEYRRLIEKIDVLLRNGNINSQEIVSLRTKWNSLEVSSRERTEARNELTSLIAPVYVKLQEQGWKPKELQG